MLSFDPASDFATAKSRELVLGLLEHTEEPLSKEQFAPGHITCTGLVLHPERDAILLIHHRKLDRWLLPGGHVEDVDDEPWQTALHQAASDGNLALAELLLARGADPNIGDARFDAPPLGFARYAGQEDLIALLEPLTDT